MRVAPDPNVPPLDELGTVHLVGIAGAGLSAIARLLAQQGVRVQGSDAAMSPMVESLRSEGITVHVGHAAEHLGEASTVIVSTAVREDNPEIVQALSLGLRLWPRSTGLMAAMLSDTRVAVSGTHGKTTTTAMLTCAARGAGADPSFAIGATVPALGTNARRGTTPTMIVEADESDGAFLHYAPSIAVVTNVDADHLDAYGSSAAYEAAFAEFLMTAQDAVVVCIDDPVARRLVESATFAESVSVRTAGFDPDADVRGSELEIVVDDDGPHTRFTVSLGHRVARCELAVPGEHYARDALLAIAAGLELGLDLDGLIAGLADYTGADRRMQAVAEVTMLDGPDPVTIVDSYAHHPSEIRADLAAARQWAGTRRLVAVFQPHLVSRTRIFAEQMGRELSSADLVVLSDIYLARERPDPDVSSELVARAVESAEVILAGPAAEVPRVMVEHVRAGDFVLTLGAGDVTTVGPALKDLLVERGASAR